jgi:chorismate mutase
MLKEIFKSLKESKNIQIEIQLPLGVEYKDVDSCISDALWEIDSVFPTSVVGEIDDYDNNILVDVSNVKDKNKFKKFLDKIQKKYSDCIYQIIIKG